MTSTIRSHQPGIDDTDLEVLYARYWGMVVGYLRGQGARDPEDLAGDVFVGVVRNLERFTGDESAFRSWLLVIAHRRLVDQRRAAARRPVEVHEPLHLTSLLDAYAVGNAEDDALGNLETARVVAALDDLTDDQRTVVLLHAVGDLSLPQIATMMNKRLGAVKSLHHRGLAAAARALGGADAPGGVSA